MRFEKKIKAAKDMPDSNLKLSTLTTLALQASPHSNAQNDLQAEINRLRKAGYQISIPEKYKPKTSASGEKYEVHIVGSKAAPVIYDDKAQAEKTKKNAELLGYEMTIKKVKQKKEASKMADKKKKDDKTPKKVAKSAENGKTPKTQPKPVASSKTPKTSAQKPVVKRSEPKPAAPKKATSIKKAGKSSNVIHKDDKELIIRLKHDTNAGKAGDLVSVKKGENGWSDGKNSYFVSHLRNSDFVEIIGRGQSFGKSTSKKSDKQLMHSDKDEMKADGKKPIIVNGQNAKAKPAPKVLRRAGKKGGYTAWDEVKRKGKTFATEKEAKDYAAEVKRKTGKIVPVSPTDRQVTHTFKAEEADKKK